jgi:hypothetical protein
MAERETMWERRHQADEWVTRVILQADGHYRYNAQQGTHPGWSGIVGTLEDAQKMADSKVTHDCISEGCTGWRKQPESQTS